MKGDSKKVLNPEDYRAAFAPLIPIMKGKRDVCILFDDLSRPTRTYEIIPHLLDTLKDAGARNDQVHFICALGTHSPHTNADFRKKLGREILENFPVYNHNCYENCETIGATALGTPVTINKEYLSCDLRIGIGSFIPHQFCGFSGGYKIVFPGIAHIDSIAHHHGQLLRENLDNCYGLGNYACNAILSDIREAGRMARLDLKIDVFVNSLAQATDVFAGRPDDLYPEMIEGALAHYATESSAEFDIVFVNAYGKANEAIIAVSVAEGLLSPGGGYVVLLCDIEEGQVIHYLMGRFGNNTWGRLPRGERQRLGRLKNLFIFARHKDHAGSFWFGKKEDIVWVDDLDILVSRLSGEYAGKRPRVAVIPDGTVQMIV